MGERFFLLRPASLGKGGLRLGLLLFPEAEVAEVVDDGVINGGKDQGDDGGDHHTRDHSDAHVGHHLVGVSNGQGHGHHGQDGGKGGHQDGAHPEGAGVEDGVLPALSHAPAHLDVLHQDDGGKSRMLIVSAKPRERTLMILLPRPRSSV